MVEEFVPVILMRFAAIVCSRDIVGRRLDNAGRLRGLRNTRRAVPVIAVRHALGTRRSDGVLLGHDSRDGGEEDERDLHLELELEKQGKL